MSSEQWNKRYSAEEFVYGKQPNDFLKSYIDSAPQGKILLPGEGEGRNAIYAAQKGWIVDAFDSSKTAMEKALRFAREMNVKINYTTEDLLFCNPKTDYYNAVGVFFLHLPRQQRRILSFKMWESLRGGGKMVMEVFSKDQMNFKSGGPDISELLYTEQEIMNDFPCFKFELLETIERDLNEGTLHRGKSSVIRFVGVK